MKFSIERERQPLMLQRNISGKCNVFTIRSARSAAMSPKSSALDRRIIWRKSVFINRFRATKGRWHGEWTIENDYVGRFFPREFHDSETMLTISVVTRAICTISTRFKAIAIKRCIINVKKIERPSFFCFNLFSSYNSWFDFKQSDLCEIFMRSESHLKKKWSQIFLTPTVQARCSALLRIQANFNLRYKDIVDSRWKKTLMLHHRFNKHLPSRVPIHPSGSVDCIRRTL